MSQMSLNTGISVVKHSALYLNGQGASQGSVMDIAIFRTIFFELLVFFTFTLLTLHFVY